MQDPKTTDDIMEGAGKYDDENQADDKTHNVKFGCFNFRPDFLQIFNSPRWLLALLCFYITVINVELLGFRGVVVPQIEKRFNMTSTLIGSIMSTVDITCGISGIILTYYVGQRHKSKWIGYGITCFSIGSIILASPHFIAGPYYYRDVVINNTSQTNNLLCSSTDLANATLCSGIRYQSTPWVHPLMLILGLICCGIGFSVLYNVGIAYVDENISPSISPIYIAIFHMAAVIGPTIGYVVGGFFSNIFVDWPVNPKDLTSNDPRWIGAWWFGYIVVGCITLATAPLIFAFPYHLPTYQKSKIKRLAQSKSVNQAVVDNQYGKRWADFPRAFYEIARNRIFLLATIGISIDQIPVIGFLTFLPKYFQSQSGASLLTSTTLSGATVVVSAALGQVLGGFITKRWNLIGSKISRFCFIVCIVNALCSFFLLISCDNPKIAGVYVSYPQPSNNTVSMRYSARNTIPFISSAICNSNCHCDPYQFNPVCGENGISYQSPCHAGCITMQSNANPISTNYSKCSCVDSMINTTTVTSGMCPYETCPSIYPLTIGIMTMVVCTFLSFAPTLTVILRSMPESQTTFGMGVEGLIYRILGGLLGPVVFGYAMDSSCSLWNVRCNERQFCWRYDNGKLAVYIFAAVAICKCSKLVVYGFLWYFHVKQEKLLENNETLDQKEKSSPLATDVKNRKDRELESTGKTKINSEPSMIYPLETQV